ncbi:MAG: ATP-grasp domain-containing protein [Desulfatibacillum sp.]|nr:ATP-grasp domain-containing protein [Desulfatibacillum sp.]
MYETSRVLVVGTTPDYVDRIRTIRPGKALFLTSPQLREKALETPPAREEEILCPLKPKEALQAVERHLAAHDLTLGGIACFDCETMILTATLAKELELDYPALDAVMNCRNKYRAKNLWQAAHLPTPRFGLVNDSGKAWSFMEKTRPPWVAKPLDGSGSSLVFKLEKPGDLEGAAAKAKAFYVKQGQDAQKAWPMLLEEMAPGPEYSADFLFVGGQARILRLTAKHRLASELFGITQAYELRENLLSEKDRRELENLFARAARALGLAACICMVDFILNEQGPWLLEIAPRPGGDCLPLLLRKAGGPDTMGFALDFAGKAPLPQDGKTLSPHVGLRIFAPCNGVLEKLETEALLRDKRVVCFESIRQPGDRVELPPKDYDSWILANIIYKPRTGEDIALQNRELSSLVSVRIKRP